jgi:hypothetical protein
MLKLKIKPDEKNVLGVFSDGFIRNVICETDQHYVFQIPDSLKAKVVNYFGYLDVYPARDGIFSEAVVWHRRDLLVDGISYLTLYKGRFYPICEKC